MVWVSETLQLLVFLFIGYSLAMVLGNLFYKFSYELCHEYKNITLYSVEMKGIIWTLIRKKLDNVWQNIFIVAVVTALFTSEKFWETISKHSDFWMVFFVTFFNLLIPSLLTSNCLEDTYKYFIRNSGLDCGSFMAYSFYYGFLRYVVASNSEVTSKGLVERMTDYEAKHGVYFPIKKLLILQPQSMCIPPTLATDTLQIADSLEVIKLNRGGVVDRAYQLSVYKINGPNWYVNVQGASSLLTYFEESERSQLLDKYRPDVALSFRRHLDRLIGNDLRCRGLVEVIYYNDLDEHGDRIDVGVLLKKHIEESLQKKALSDGSM